MGDFSIIKAASDNRSAMYMTIATNEAPGEVRKKLQAAIDNPNPFMLCVYMDELPKDDNGFIQKLGLRGDYFDYDAWRGDELRGRMMGEVMDAFLKPPPKVSIVLMEAPTPGEVTLKIEPGAPYERLFNPIALALAFEAGNYEVTHIGDSVAPVTAADKINAGTGGLSRLSGEISNPRELPPPTWADGKK